ncbi:MAG: Holliday junction resolvase RuvX [Candidatus Nanopelagicaceae bacterium]|nr:Holliday junction resolvase RuvX [Candidatus Nanopelagicaceae bacterium]
MPLGRRLAVDIGDVRTGVAISDAAGILASPYATVSGQDYLTKIAEIVNSEGVTVVYVGLPLHLSGQEGDAAAKVRVAVSKLKKLLTETVIIRLLDERLTTKSASSKVISNHSKVNRSNIDQLAAVEILEFALNSERLTRELAGNDAVH